MEVRTRQRLRAFLLRHGRVCHGSPGGRGGRRHIFAGWKSRNSIFRFSR